MSPRSFLSFVAASCLTLVPFSPTVQAEDQDVPPAAASPVEPEASLAHFRLDAGLRIELVAAEPEVIDPIALRFDEDGRLWVVEMRDYPHGPTEGEAPRSRIRVLRDRDGDGRFETSRVFAERLLFPTGLQPWRGGVLVTLAGQIVYLKDTTGDGRADLSETWYTGFVEQNPQLRASHPRLAADGFVYVANGLRGGSIVSARSDDAEAVSISGMDFRFDPLTDRYEATSGLGQFGLTFDDFGNRFVCSNRNPLRHVVLEDRYVRRNPHLAVPAVMHDVAAADADSRVFALTRAWTTSNLHAGQFTAASGVHIYRGDALPEAYYANAFTCESTGNLVHREVLQPLGGTFDSRPAQEGVEFLASTDEWFRPVNLELGPDGALYVIDMYRAVIEHPDWMPEELRDRRDLLDGNDRGRIYRIVAADRSSNGEAPRLSATSSVDLVAYLEHPNAWWRETAGRLLLERQDPTVQAALERLARSSKQPAGRVAALWALRTLDLLADDVIEQALQDSDPRVRETAVVLSEARLDEAPALRRRVLDQAADPDARLRFQTALSLGYATGDDVVPALATIALRGVDDRWTRWAVATAAVDRAGRLLAEIVHRDELSAPRQQGAKRALVQEVAELVGSSSPPDAAAAALASLDGIVRDDVGEGLQRAALVGLARGLARRGSSLHGFLQGIEAAHDGRRLAESALEAAARRAANRELDATERGGSIELLRYASADQAVDALLSVAAETERPGLQSQAIAALSAHRDPRIAAALLELLPEQTPAIRRAMLDNLLASADRIAALLDAVERGDMAPTELDRPRVDRLLTHRDQELRERARTLLAAALPPPRDEVLDAYRSALDMPADPLRGRAVFERNCGTCHRVADVGVDVGPDISDSRVRKPAQLLTDILDPNRAIDGNYVSYSVATTEGQLHVGIIAAETASSITLRQPENQTVTLLRNEIDEIRSSGISFMPEGLERNIGLQEMADLISFIKNWRYLDGAIPLREESGGQ